MLPSSRKLNIFQRGILQKGFTFCVYTICLISASLFLDWLDKKWFIKAVNNALAKGEIPEKVAQAFTILIQSRDELFFLFLIFFGATCGLAGFLLVRLAARFQWSWPVTLPEAVEFRQAMEKLGITDPDDRIDFVRKHYVPVYIAFKPITGFMRNKVKARLYAFSDSAPFGSRRIFNTYIGSQLLCLDERDYKYLLENFEQINQIAQLSKIGSLEDTIASLKGTLSLQQDEIATLQKENATIKTENEENKNRLRTLAGREKKIDNRAESKIPFRRVAYPLVNRLIIQVKPDSKYTRTQIQDEFMLELEAYPELEKEIARSLWTQKKEENNTPFDLSGWAMEEIRTALGNYAQKDPGRQK